MRRTRRSVLFVCTMNAVRSPMAAALLRHLLAPACWSNRRGWSRASLDPLAVEVMAEIGIDLSGHQPRRLDDLKPGL